MKKQAEEKAGNDQTEQRRERREIEDLRAQKQQALWAEWAVYVAGGGLLISLGAVIGVLFSLREARKTTAAASKSADAALAAVAVATKTAERQLRAYMSCEPHMQPGFFVNRSGANITMLAKNRGQTPATGFVQWTRTDIFPEGYEGPFRRMKETPKQKFARLDIAPGEEMHVVATHPRFTPAEWESLCSQTHNLLFFGRFIYWDAFQRRRYLQFCNLVILRPDGGYHSINTYHHGNQSN